MKTNELELYIRGNAKPQFYTRAVSELFKQKKFEQAEKLVVEGLDNFPRDKFLWSQYGEILCQFGEASDLIEAVRAYENAIKFGANKQVDIDALENAKTQLREKTPVLSAVFDETATVKIYMGIATSRRKNGQEDEAIALFQEAVEVFPNDNRLWHQLGKTLSHAGRFEEAAKALEKSIDIEPDDRITREDLEANRRQMQRHNRR